MAPVAPRRGRLLGPLWADPDEILRGRRASVWLRMMRISLGWVELRGCSGRKTEKKRQKPTIFAVFGLGCLTARPIAQHPVGRFGQNFAWLTG